MSYAMPALDLNEEIFPSIDSRQIAGYRGIQLLRRDLADEVEFVTIMWFDCYHLNKKSTETPGASRYECPT